MNILIQNALNKAPKFTPPAAPRDACAPWQGVKSTFSYAEAETTHYRIYNHTGIVLGDMGNSEKLL